MQHCIGSPYGAHSVHCGHSLHLSGVIENDQKIGKMFYVFIITIVVLCSYLITNKKIEESKLVSTDKLEVLPEHLEDIGSGIKWGMDID